MEFSCTIWYAHQKITFDDTSVQTSVGRVNRRLTVCCLLLDICCDENKYGWDHSLAPLRRVVVMKINMVGTTALHH